VHRVVGVHECVVDEGFKVATAPAYMYAEANAWQVSVGIGKMVEQVFRLSAQG
jgi:enhancing lycopene biosynthesis protein 2